MDKFCVIANPSLELGGGIRHIMRVSDNETKDDIRSRYYEDYRKLDGDEFYLCDDLAQAQHFAERYAEDHDQS